MYSYAKILNFKIILINFMAFYSNFNIKNINTPSIIHTNLYFNVLFVENRKEAIDLDFWYF